MASFTPCDYGKEISLSCTPNQMQIQLASARVEHFAIFEKVVFAITSKTFRFSIENIESICSLDSKLFSFLLTPLEFALEILEVIAKMNFSKAEKRSTLTSATSANEACQAIFGDSGQYRVYVSSDRGSDEQFSQTQVNRLDFTTLSFDEQVILILLF